MMNIFEQGEFDLNAMQTGSKVCLCDAPLPNTKVSENGIHTYCARCLKDYQGLNGSYTGESDD